MSAMSADEHRPGAIGALLRRLVAVYVPPARQDAVLHVASRLLDSSLSTSPSIQTTESLSHTILFRLVRERKHAESSKLAETIAELRFEPAITADSLWGSLYVLNDLRGTSGEALQNHVAKFDTDAKQASTEIENKGSQSPLSTETVAKDQELFTDNPIQRSEEEVETLGSVDPFQPGSEPRASLHGNTAHGSESEDDQFFLMPRTDLVKGTALDKKESEASERQEEAPEPEKSPKAGPAPMHSKAIEKMLICDLLLVVQGEEGKVLSFHDSDDSDSVSVSMPVGTALPIAVRDLAMYVSELGFLFRIIRKHVESTETTERGLVVQNMCSAIQREMDNYYRSLVALRGIESLISDNDDDNSGLSLRKIYVWAEGEKPRLRWLARLCEETKKMGGGQILAHLQAHRGSYLAADIHDMMSRILSRTSAPINRMLQRWLSEGVLTDTNGEFFIMEDPKIAAASRTAPFSIAALTEEVGVSGGLSGGPNSASMASQRIWWGLFKQRKDQRPGTLDSETAQKALIADPRFDGDPIRTVIDAARDSASRRLKALFFNKFDLSHHFGAIKNYLLLSQGDFSQALMDGLAPILDGDAGILRNNLTGIVDTALQGCSSFSEETDQDILERLDVQIAPHSNTTNVGWDVFSLTYRVEDAPLNTVFSPKVMAAYLLIFRLLWRLKRMDYLMGLAYMNLCQFDDRNSTSRLREDMELWKQVLGVVRRAHFVRMKMTHMVQNMQHYCTVEVLEGSWTVLEAELAAAEDLDGMIYSHSVYLTRIKDRTLLSERSKYIALELNAVLDVIPYFNVAQQEIYGWLERDGYSADKVGDVEVKVMKARVEDIEKRFNASFSLFLSALRRHCKVVDSCVFLLFRLDFNEHYTRRRAAEKQVAEAASQALDDLEGEESNVQSAGNERTTITGADGENDGGMEDGV